MIQDSFSWKVYLNVVEPIVLVYGVVSGDESNYCTGLLGTNY